MTGKWHGLVIDTPDPRGLATFYQELLGFVRVQDEDHWVVIGDAADRPGLAFQLAPDLQPPGWPAVWSMRWFRCCYRCLTYQRSIVSVCPFHDRVNCQQPGAGTSISEG
jgi:hypothetical protein